MGLEFHDHHISFAAGSLNNKSHTVSLITLFLNRLVDMFHAASCETDKERILHDFPQKNSPIRILIATIAFGLGIDIPDIRLVINWGMPSNMLQYWQEVN